MRITRRQAFVILLVILAAGFGLRIWDIANTPSELIVDELDLYNSIHSIARTGHDIDGTLLPFFYCSLTRNPPMYAIAEYITSLFFGNGPFGLRLPAVIFGCIAIALMYGIAYELTKRRDIAVTTALLIATQPIFIHFSRIAWEPASELPFLLAGIYVLLRVFDRPDGRIAGRGLALAAVLLGASAYTYAAAWFYAFVLGGAVFALNVPRLRSRSAAFKLTLAAAIWLIVAAPALWMWFGDGHPYARTARMATFQTGINPATMHQFASNYLAHFHWTYLVTTGDPVSGATWRYLAGFGAFFWWTVPLAVLGFIALKRFVRVRWMAVWLTWWLIMYPMGGALTNDGGPNAPRTLAGAPVFCILAAIGLAALFAIVWRVTAERARMPVLTTLRAACAIVLLLSVVLFSRFYFTTFDREYPNAWDSGTRSTFAVIRARLGDYDRLCFSVRSRWYEPEVYFRYYLYDRPTPAIDGVDAPACFLPGTLMATDAPVEREGFKPLAATLEIDGGVFAVIAGRPRSASRVRSASTDLRHDLARE